MFAGVCRSNIWPLLAIYLSMISIDETAAATEKPIKSRLLYVQHFSQAWPSLAKCWKLTSNYWKHGEDFAHKLNSWFTNTIQQAGATLSGALNPWRTSLVRNPTSVTWKTCDSLRVWHGFGWPRSWDVSSEKRWSFSKKCVSFDHYFPAFVAFMQ